MVYNEGGGGYKSANIFMMLILQNNLIAALSDSVDFAEFDNSNASVKLLGTL